MSEQLKQELEADTDRLEAETVADSETIGEQEEKPTEGKLEDQKGDESKEEIEAAEAENAKPVKQKAREKLEAEYKELMDRIRRLEAILADRNLLLRVIREEILAISEKYGSGAC